MNMIIYVLAGILAINYRSCGLIHIRIFRFTAVLRTYYSILFYLISIGIIKLFILRD